MDMTPSELTTYATLQGLQVEGLVVRFNGYQCELFHAEGKWHANTIGEGVDGEAVLIMTSEWEARKALDKVTEWRRQLDMGEFNDEDDYPW